VIKRIAAIASALLAAGALTAGSVPAANAATTPAAASATFCIYDPDNSPTLYAGSNYSGDQIPINTVCRVEYTRINFADVNKTGYYEYQAISGPSYGIGLCMKEDPGIIVGDEGFHPVVSYPCSTSGATAKEERFTDALCVQYDETCLTSGTGGLATGDVPQVWTF